MSKRPKLTHDERQALLMAERLPSGQTWLSVFRVATAKAGANLRDVVGGERFGRAVEARNVAWAVLRAGGYSFPELARGTGYDHSTIIPGIRKAPPEAVAAVVAQLSAELPPPGPVEPTRTAVAAAVERPAVPAVDLRQVALFAGAAVEAPHPAGCRCFRCAPFAAAAGAR